VSLGKEETVDLTEGNLRNNYLRVCQFQGLIPDEVITSGGEVVLDLEGVGEIRSHVDKKKGILTERRAIRKFFEVHGLKAFDQIGVEKIGQRDFRIRPMQRKEISSCGKAEEREEEPQGQAQEDDQLLLFEQKKRARRPRKIVGRRNLVRANELGGKEWTAHSVSVWRDIRKSNDERRLDHPAMFPVMLVQRVIRCFTTSSDKVVLDPFMGSGSTLVGAYLLGRKAIGFEVYVDYVELAEQRLSLCRRRGDGADAYIIYQEDARKLADFIRADSVDFCFTSPPY